MKIVKVKWEPEDIESGLMVKSPSYHEYKIVASHVISGVIYYGILSLKQWAFVPLKTKWNVGTKEQIAEYLTNQCFLPNKKSPLNNS